MSIGDFVSGMMVGDDSDTVERLQQENRQLRDQYVRARAAAAGHRAVKLTLLQALNDVAPNHQLAKPSNPDPLDKIYKEASALELQKCSMGG